MTGKSAVIICDGQFPRKEYPRYLISSADYIVCCDGAFEKYLRNCEKIFGCQRLPDKVVGDMDSLSPALKERYKHLIFRVEEQETNDQTKAFTFVVGHYKDVSQIHIIGATGAREDHTIGNMSLLMEYARTYDLESMGIAVDMVSDYSTIFAVTDTFEMQCGRGRSISILTPDNALKIKSEGLEWQTSGVTFDNWWKSTLNRSNDDTVKLFFSHKSIALIVMD